MATARFALDWPGEKQEAPEPLSKPAKVVSWEEPRASRRVIAAAQKEVDVELERAAEIFQHTDDGDVEDVYSKETLDRASGFLKLQLEWMWQSCGVRAAVPALGPGPKGSVDLFWKQQDWELLVNIPPSGKDATFYGDNYGNERSRGSFDPAIPSISIAAWLMK